MKTVTLKDLGKQSFVYKDMLKAEAIKWVKKSDKGHYNLDTNDFLDFFNITEEDLEDGVYLKEDVKEFIRRLKDFVISRNKNIEINKNNPRINWKTIGTTELSNVLFEIDKLAGEKLI